jgi:23S rRNA (cytosine1962-C5)-methyltransferase
MQERSNPPEITLLTPSGWADYELLDSGGGAKLERYGLYTFVRPEHQAIWQPALPSSHWQSAHAIFQPAPIESGGNWKFTKPIPPAWHMSYKELKFQVQATASRHMGVFPEQASHWNWMDERIRSSQRPIRALNLFGYTGLATLAAARAGAAVTHVDASKKAIQWARTNQELSGLRNCPVRWLVDDVEKFVHREVRRGSQYEALILDPPKFGRGPEGQIWEFFEALPNLLHDCRALLSPRPLFVILTAYAIRASALSVYYALAEMLDGFPGMITGGELALVERSAGRLLSMAIFASWEAE